jgi:O-succinylbenzoic acid--CoA ligase
MTETVSHIALRRLSGDNASEWYEPFAGVMLSLSEEDTLCIDASEVTDGTLITKDVAELLPDGRFRILGRTDNVINSGGIKIHPEIVEKKISKVLSVPFAVTSAPDDKFGEAVVLLVETLDIGQKALDGKEDTDAKSDVSRLLSGILTEYERPKRIVFVDKLPLTANGKTDRAACKAMTLLNMPDVST